MIEILNSYSDCFLNFFIEQSLSVIPLFLLIMILSYILRFKYPGLIHGLWSFFFLRLLIPVERLFAFFHFEKSLTSAFNIKNFHLPPMNDFSAFYTSETGQSFEPSLSLFIFVIWILILSFMAIRFLNQRRKSFNIKNNSVVTSQDVLLHAVSKWRRILGINTKIDLRVSNLANSAFNSGYFHPAIILPFSYLQFNEEELDIIIAHECAHIKRYDNLKLLLQYIIQSVFFFHPLVWIGAKQMNLSREQTCDTMVIKKGKVAPFFYGSVLINSLRQAQIPALKTGFNLYKSFMKIRLKTLTRSRKMKKSILLIIATAAIIISLFSWGYSQKVKTQSKTQTSTEQNITEVKQAFIQPLKTGKVSSRFGMRKHPIFKITKMHNGIDIAAPKGTPIYATADGLVSFADRNGGYGKVIIINHAGGWQTFYAQLSKIKVVEGQEIKRGQEIGLVGSSGLSTAPHLHYELRKDGKSVNPETYIKFYL